MLPIFKKNKLIHIKLEQSIFGTKNCSQNEWKLTEVNESKIYYHEKFQTIILTHVTILKGYYLLFVICQQRYSAR